MSYTSPFTGNVVQPTDVSYEQIALTSQTGTIQLVWPVNGNLSTDTPAARIMNVSTTNVIYELWMPPATQVSVGQDALIRNVGATTLTVKAYGGANTIVAIAAGEAKYIYVTSNSTAAGTWGIISFGVGSSSADAASLAGYGLKAISTTLNQSHPVLTTSSAFTADATYRAKTVVWNGGVGAITLDSAATLGNDWFMLVRNGGTGLLTIDGTGSETINGELTLGLQISDSTFICCSGTSFFTIGLGQSTTFAYSQLVLPVTTGTYVLTPAQAQNTIIKVTGSVTGTVTVQVPAAVQVYFALNQTTGAFNTTFTTGVMGGLTATLQPNQQATLVCDSVNVLNATTVITGGVALSIIDGSAGAPALNFTTETNMGMYKAASGQIGWAIGGVAKMLLTSDGLSGGAF